MTNFKISQNWSFTIDLYGKRKIYNSPLSGLHTRFLLGGGGGGGEGGDRIHLRSRINNINLARLTIGGPELVSVDFTEYSCNG